MSPSPATPGIVPPYLLRHLAAHGGDEDRGAAIDTLMATERLRGERGVRGPAQGEAAGAGRRRTIYDAGHLERLPGKLVREESGAPSRDEAVNEAYDGLGATFDFYAEILRRSSIDGRGGRLDATVHFGKRYDNAFWNGRQMVFGDGDGKLFRPFTGCLEVIGHELSHGVVETEAALEYADQPGALNESLADVLGLCVKYWKLHVDSASATWLVGEGLLAAGVRGLGLRSLKAPGTAYDDPRLGVDPQPAHLRGYVRTDDDHGGVHVNSGIPNHAFYLAAIAFGGYAWERAGAIWYHALCHHLERTSGFSAAAAATMASARTLFGADAEGTVRDAWAGVGVAPERPRVS